MPLLVTCHRGWLPITPTALRPRIRPMDPAQAPWEASCLVPYLTWLLLESEGHWEVYSLPLGYTPWPVPWLEPQRNITLFDPLQSSGSRDSGPHAPMPT